MPPNKDITYGLFLGLCAVLALALPIHAQIMDQEKEHCVRRLINPYDLERSE